nr:uncharacterized protein LOC129155108 [Nothobranchius furzeri]
MCFYFFFQAKSTQGVGCQTDLVICKNALVQAHVKPYRHSKATQFRAPSRSVSCDTGTVMEIHLPQSPRAASTPLKRPRYEVSVVDPSFHLNDSASSVNCSSSFTEVHPQKDKKYIVHEKQLLGLFRRCPVCTGRCVVNTTTVGTLLRVTQRCSCCEHYNEWSSQPMVNSIPAGNLQLCAAVLFTGSSFSHHILVPGCLQCAGTVQADILSTSGKAVNSNSELAVAARAS